jgi:ABC-type nitrate/sulfonate/bicarbonate transport system substrate-binding protein
MKLNLACAAALVALSSVAFAQMPAPTGSSTTPAVPPAGMPGSSPQTATSARTQIEASGYTKIKELKRNEDGSWQAIATKNDVEVSVSVDTTGNVTQISR